MNQQYITTAQTTLEDVRHLFEQWREGRKHRTPIPEELWAKAASLSVNHSIHKISRSLRLNHSALMKRVCSSRTEDLPDPPQRMTSHAFIELGMKASIPDAEYIMVREDLNGSKMKMHIKGNTGIDPLCLIRAFWEKGL